MKKTSARRKTEKKRDDLLPEYRFDYSKAKPNRFAARMSDAIAVVLEPDVAAVFKSSKTVNSLLRSVISAVPAAKRKKAS
jgi:translation elongation factor EF-4